MGKKILVEIPGDNDDFNEGCGAVLGAIFAICAIIYVIAWLIGFVIYVAVIDIPLLALIIGFYNREKKAGVFFFLLSIIGAFLLLVDYNMDWIVMSNIKNNFSQTISATLVTVLLYLNVASGMVAFYFVVRKKLIANNTAFGAWEDKIRHFIYIKPAVKDGMLGYGIIGGGLGLPVGAIRWWNGWTLSGPIHLFSDSLVFIPETALIFGAAGAIIGGVIGMFSKK